MSRRSLARRAKENPTPWEWAGIVGIGVGVLAGGIALAVVLSKPANAAPSPSPTPTPPPAPNVNPTNFTFTPGHRYQILFTYSVAIPPVSQAVAQSTVGTLVGSPVTIVSVTQPTTTSVQVTFDYAGATAVSPTIPGPIAPLTSTSITDLGLTANQ